MLRTKEPTVVEGEGECRFFVVDKEEDDKFFFAHWVYLMIIDMMCMFHDHQ